MSVPGKVKTLLLIGHRCEHQDNRKEIHRCKEEKIFRCEEGQKK